MYTLCTSTRTLDRSSMMKDKTFNIIKSALAQFFGNSFLVTTQGLESDSQVNPGATGHRLYRVGVSS